MVSSLQSQDSTNGQRIVSDRGNDGRRFSLMTAVAAFVCFACTAGVAMSSGLPHVVVIVVDDMGYGDPGCYNPRSKIATPNIDALAEDGMRFTDAHAAGPLCHMSRFGLLTGCYPFRIDVTRWPSEPLIKPGQATFASVAQESGYRTAMVGKWHLGFREGSYDEHLPGGPIDHGFDSFFGIRASTDIPPYFYIRGDRAVQPPTNRIEENHSEGWAATQGAFWRGGGIAPDMKLDEVLPRFTDEAIQVIDRHADNSAEQPLLLYLAYPSPHTPWLPSEEFQGKSSVGMYGDFVMMVDHEIGRVLEALRLAGMTEDTLVVFTSDNGPMWRDEDRERFGHDSAGGLRGMKGDAWEAGHRMPFIVRWPGVVTAGSRTDQTISFTDLLATMAEIAGVDLPPGAGPDSFSFLPVLRGEQPEDEPVRGPLVVAAGSVPKMMTIRGGDWKLITELGSGGFSKPKRIEPQPGGPAGQLYNLAADPGEQNNLYQQHPKIVAHGRRALQRVLEAGMTREAEPVLFDNSTLKGKVLCGYQGWFNTPGDGMGLGWTHWSRKGKTTPGPGNITVDLWPDLSEFDSDERYATEFRHADGRVAEVFSSANRKTVERHFQWMQDYGIDGVFLQRFANGLIQTDLRDHKDVVLSHVRLAARQTGRVYAVMYDLSGLSAGGVERVYHDWRVLQEKHRVTEDPTYLHHNGKPLVAVWGVGFGSDNKPREYSLEECATLVARLKDEGISVMLGVPTGWRELTRDAMNDRALHDVIKSADIVSPWTPGRYRTLEGVSEHAQRHWKPDARWCRRQKLAYLPVVFPGFSWHNLKGDELGAIPRLKGRFLWSQMVEARRSGAETIYVAMFDEVDEGTAIFKCTDDPPVGEGVSFLGYEGLASDHYLWLTGEGGRMLRGETPATREPPERGRLANRRASAAP